MSKAKMEMYMLGAELYGDALLQIKFDELAEKDYKTIPQIPHFC